MMEANASKPAKDSWTKDVTPGIAAKLTVSARAARNNGREIWEDANVLFESQRYARATVLGIYAAEELSKAGMLLISATQGRWDSEVHQALNRSHAAKHALYEAIMPLVAHLFREVRSPTRNPLFPPSVSSIVAANEGEWLKQISDVKRTFMKKRKTDKAKWARLYVEIFEDGSCRDETGAATEREAAEQLDFGRRFANLLAPLLGDAFEERLVRTHNSVARVPVGWGLRHREGFDLDCWAHGPRADQEIFEFVSFADKLGKADACEATSLDPVRFASAKAFAEKSDLLPRVRKQMAELRLRCSYFHDALERLAAEPAST